MGELHRAAGALRDRLESSPLIGWMKDLDGRYVYVNRSYVEQLDASADRVLGHLDSELPPREAIDGPRLQERATLEDEPMQLEYRVAAFEGRPALAALRFPVRDEDGNPICVCGVAAPVEQAQLARAQCSELMALETGGGGTAAGTGELEQERRRVAALHDASASAARRAHELAVELATEREQRQQLERQLGLERDRRERVEQQLGEAAATVADAGAEDGRVEDLSAAVEHERSRAHELEALIGRERSRAVELESEVQELRTRVAAVEDDEGRQRARADQAEAALRGAREREQAAVAEQRRRAEEAEVQASEAFEERACARAAGEAAAREDLARAAARVEAAEAELSEERARAEAVQAALADERVRSQAVQAELAEEQARCEAAQAEAHRTRSLVESLRMDLAHATARRDQLEAEQRSLSEALEQARLEAAHAAEPTGPEASAGVGGPPSWTGRAQRALAAAMSHSSEWRTAIRDAVKVIGAQGGWDAVSVWLEDDRRPQHLKCAAMWLDEADRRVEFETQTWQRPHAISGTEIGRAFHAGEAAWLTGISQSDDERLAAAALEGMTTALIVPVCDGTASVAVLELLSGQTVPPDEDLAAALTAVALQLGHFWHLLKVGAAPHWRVGRF